MLRALDGVPGTTRRVFTIATPDHRSSLVLPGLIRRLGRAAPAFEIRVLPLQADTLERLESGEVDVVLHTPLTGRPSPRTRTLFDEEFVCLVRRGHPEVGRRITLQNFLELPHVMVMIDPAGRVWSEVDALLARRGQRRRVTAAVPNFLLVPHIVVASDHIAVYPKRAALRAAAGLPVRLLKPPVPLKGFKLAMIWHERNQTDPPHRLLREQLAKGGSSG